MAGLSRKEKLQKGTSRGMLRSAANRQCPQCRRKEAIKRVSDELFIVRVCRFGCGWEQATMR